MVTPLEIPRYPGRDKDIPIEDLQPFMDQLTQEPIAIENWETYPDKPKVSFSMAWKDHLIFLKFYVKEYAIRAVYTQDNDPVYRDSCVEFFFTEEKEGKYYNIETNCIGTSLVQQGTSRNDRSFLSTAIISQIRRIPSLGRLPIEEKQGFIGWDLLMLIPVSILTDIHLPLEGKTLFANFYKCGDDLSSPHYLSWSPIKTAQPDFHQPKYFSPIVFA